MAACRDGWRQQGLSSLRIDPMRAVVLLPVAAAVKQCTITGGE